MLDAELKIEKEVYDADLALLDRYQAFSSEILRVSLLGIAGIGFFAEKLLSAHSQGSKISAWIAVITFGWAAACALGHRYYSTDGIFHHLRGARRKVQDQKIEVDLDRQRRNKLYALSGQFLFAATLLAAIGALSLGLSFLFLLGA